MKKNFLYTGRNINYNKDFDKRKVRTDRRPKDIKIDIHTAIDDWFYRKFGIRFRSNAVFASFQKDVVHQYGHIYIIFPIGNYTVVSSDRVHDLYIALTTIKLYDEDLDYLNFDINDPNQKEALYNVLDEEFEYKKGLRWNKSEQMINCKEYYLVSSDFELDLKEIL